MLQERDVFREVIRLVGLALLVYGLYTGLQSGISVLYFSTFFSTSTIWLQLSRPLSYHLLGLLLLLGSTSIAAFAYPRGQTSEWSSRQILTMGIKLSGLWLVIAHLGTFLQQLEYCLVQLPMVGSYQTFTHSIWPAVAIYLVIIIIGAFL